MSRRYFELLCTSSKAIYTASHNIRAKVFSDSLPDGRTDVHSDNGALKLLTSLITR